MSIKRLLIVGLAGAVICGLYQAPATAATTEVPLMGVQFHAMWSDYTDAQRLEVLDKMAAAGVTWVRIDLGWASFQEQGPTSYSRWYIDRANFVIDAARARGIKVLGTLWYTPGWANGNRGRSVPPSDASLYGEFTGWAAGTFAGRVDAWEIWNEPNHRNFFTGTPAQYVELLKAAYPEIKAADPAATVVLGGPAYNDTDWLKKVYDAGAQGYFDVMATHPYQGVADAAPETPDDGSIWLLTHVEAVHDLMVRYGDGDKKIWFTEFGWSSHANWAGVENWDRGVTLQEQGEYLVRTLEFVGERYPYVTNVFWYNERNRDDGDIRNDNYGLLYRDLSPKPAYLTLQAFLVGSGAGAEDATDAPAPEPTVSPEPTAAATPAPTATAQPTSKINDSTCTTLKRRKARRKCLRRLAMQQVSQKVWGAGLN